MSIKRVALYPTVVVLIVMIVWLLQPRPDFTIEGDVAPSLSPGVSAPLNLVISNPHSYPIKVSALSVSVQRITASTATSQVCDVSNFVVRQAPDTVRIVLAPHSRQTLNQLHIPRSSWPSLGMVNYRTKSQDACKGVRLTLAYSAAGTFWTL